MLPVRALAATPQQPIGTSLIAAAGPNLAAIAHGLPIAGRTQPRRRCPCYAICRCAVRSPNGVSPSWCPGWPQTETAALGRTVASHGCQPLSRPNPTSESDPHLQGTSIGDCKISLGVISSDCANPQHMACRAPSDQQHPTANCLGPCSPGRGWPASHPQRSRVANPNARRRHSANPKTNPG